MQLTHRPLIKFRALPQFAQKLRASKCLNRCQNTAPSSLEKQTLVVSLGELKPRELNSKTCVYSAQVSTDSQAKIVTQNVPCCSNTPRTRGQGRATGTSHPARLVVTVSGVDVPS